MDYGIKKSYITAENRVLFFVVRLDEKQDRINTSMGEPNLCGYKKENQIIFLYLIKEELWLKTCNIMCNIL